MYCATNYISNQDDWSVAGEAGVSKKLGKSAVTLRLWKSLFRKKRLSWRISSSFMACCCCRIYQLKRERCPLLFHKGSLALHHTLTTVPNKIKAHSRTHREPGWNCHQIVDIWFIFLIFSTNCLCNIFIFLFLDSILEISKINK